MLEIKKHFILVAINYLIFFNKEILGEIDLSPLTDLINAANTVLSISLSLNMTADPCENFYQYSCGNYNGYPFADKDIQEMTQYLDDEYNTKLMQLITAKLAQPRILFANKNQTILEKTLYYYEACRAENPRNVRNYFEELQINWPLLINERRAYRNEYFWQALGQLQGYNWNNLIITHEITANKDGSLNIILVPGFNHLPSDDDIVNHLRSLNASNASVVEELKAMELNWYEIFQAFDDNNSEDYSIEMSYQHMALEYPFLRIYLQAMLNQKVNNIVKVSLSSVSFFKYLRVIQWTSDMLRQQLNYLVMHFHLYLLGDSTKGFNDLACIEDLRNKLDLPVSYMYYKAIVSQVVKIYHDLNRIINQLVSIAAEVFEENHLKLSSAQLENLKNKLENIRFNVGNLPSTVAYETIESIYLDVPNLDRRNYFKNHLLLLKHRFVKSLTYQDDHDYFIHPDNDASSGTTYYVPKQNLVVIPFANVQYPSYQNGLYSLLIVPVMGFLIAHEMGHAFDTSGLAIMGDSSILQQPSYLQSLKCLENQEPSEYMGERIADLFAERVVYRTYDKYYNGCPHTLINWQRYFYLIMAQFFCNKGELKFIEHDPSDVRLHQIVKNSDMFANVFNCPLDSPMNPRKKCRLF